MAFNYCANQYESPYRPKLLSNWEIAKNYFHYRPQQRKGATRILTNDRGHLLTNFKSQQSPWGHYLGTWYMPKKIDRNVANQLNQSTKIVDNEKRIREGIYELKKKEYVEDEIRANIIPVETLPQDNQQNKLIYTPGDLLEEKQRYTTDSSHFDAKLPEKSLINQTTNTMQQSDNDNELPKPIHDTIYNFNLAKRLHRENLEHDPLPDTLTETILKKLELDEHNHIESNCGPTGIGWKGYPGYGPMKCTKLKVYRPKATIPNHNNNNGTTNRSNSVTSFEKKWRFLRRHKVEPIELAICWDLYPENSDDEPKPSKHIDGSNGSQAPAVFSLVKQSNNTKNSCNNINNNSERIFERIDNQLGTDRDFVLERPKTSAPIQRPVFEKYEEKNRFFERLKFNKKRSKSAHDLNCKQSTITENFNKSTPNLHHTCCCCCSCCYCYSNNLRFHQDKCKSKRLCMACAMKNVNINNNDYNNNNKREFKMAFKAGIPQKSRVSNNNSYKIRFNYKAPKQRNPFSPRRYTNNSLAPPFSLQKDKSCEYPEYWRLATVYQQSYKPMQYRKRPLMATIFK